MAGSSSRHLFTSLLFLSFLHSFKSRVRLLITELLAKNPCFRGDSKHLVTGTAGVADQ